MNRGLQIPSNVRKSHVHVDEEAGEAAAAFLTGKRRMVAKDFGLDEAAD